MSCWMAGYRAGYMLECELRERFRRGGFIVFRCAGSKPVDLILVRDGRVILVEAKRNGPKKVPVEAVAMAEKTKLPLIYVCRKRRKTYWSHVGEIHQEDLERLKLILGKPR